MAYQEYSFIDVAVLDEVRGRFAAGDALAILSADLEEVLWANGPGAKLFGFPDIAAIMGAPAGLSFAQRRQVAATPGFPAIGRDRPLMVRLGAGSRVTPMLASGLAMPDGERAVLLAVPAAAADRDPRGVSGRAISGFAGTGSHAVLVGAGGGLLAAAPGFEALGIAPQTVAALVADVAREPDRLVKRLIEAGGRRLPAGIARLSDTPPTHLLVVVDDAGEEEDDEPAAIVPALPPEQAETAASDAGGLLADPAPKVVEEPEAGETPAGGSGAHQGEARQDDRWYFGVADTDGDRDALSGPGEAVDMEEEVTDLELAGIEPVAVEPGAAASGEGEPEAGAAVDDLPADEAAGPAASPAVEEHFAHAPETDGPGAGGPLADESGTDEPGTGLPGADEPESAAPPASAPAGEVAGHVAPPVEPTRSAPPQDAVADPVPAMPAAGATPARGPDRARPTAPIRFVWRTDASGKFSLVSPEFLEAVGMTAGQVVGRTFAELADALRLESSGAIAGLLARRDTWSGKSVMWPLASEGLRVPVDLAALPVYDRDRNFEGFRGFGIARMSDAVIDPDAAVPALADAATPPPAAAAPDAGPVPTGAAAGPEVSLPEEAPAGPAAPSAGGLTEVPVIAIEAAMQRRRQSDKIVRLAEHRAQTQDRTLSPGESVAFREIGDRLKEIAGAPGKPAEEAPAPIGEPAAKAGVPAIGAAEAEGETATRETGETGVETAVAAVQTGAPPGEGDASPAGAAGTAPEPAAQDLPAAPVADERPEEVEAAAPEPAMAAAPGPGLEAPGEDAPAGPDAPAEAAFEAGEPARIAQDDAEAAALEAGGPVEPALDTGERPLLAVGAEERETPATEADAFLPVSVDAEEPRGSASGHEESPEPSPERAGPATEPGHEGAPETVVDPVRADAAEEPAGIGEPRQEALPEPAADAGETSAHGDDEAAGTPAPEDGVTAAAADAGGAVRADATAVPEPTAANENRVVEPRARGTADAAPHEAAATAGFLPSAFAAAPMPEGDELVVAVVSALPVPVLVHSGDVLHFANEAFRETTGYSTLEEFDQAGGLGILFAEPWPEDETERRSAVIVTRAGDEIPVRAHLQSVPWRGRKALLLALGPADPLRRAISPAADDADRREAEAAALSARVDEMGTILDTATDGVVIIAGDGSIRSINRPAEALFGYDRAEIAGRPFASLFAVESQRAARDYLAGLSENGVASVLNDGREVIGREAQGRFIPLFMTIGRLPGGNGFCAVMRDITQWKRAEEELTQARVLAERASRQKTEFLARVSHEIRTPLNAIIGFSELMMDEKFGPIGSDRYRDYLRDINRSGNHVLDLVNDLLDISKIEAGEQEMSYEAVSLNDTLTETVAIMQPQANRERVIIRSSFASRLPDVVADLRSIRQIGLNLLSNAIRFTQPGGQVIVSTSYETTGDVVLRVRDTGVGMSGAEIEQALKPFKQINSLKRSRTDGTGLGLPLTKAMVEANRARFSIQSAPGEGTLVEIVFPSTRVLAD